MKKLFLLMVILLCFSCHRIGLDEARKIKVGMTTDSLIEIMGEPLEIEIEDGSEQWEFRYGGARINDNYMRVTVIDEKIYSFYSTK